MQESNNPVTNLDDYKPHCAIPSLTRNAVHVVPLSLVEDVASGKIDFSECEDPDWIRTIMKEWLDERS